MMPRSKFAAVVALAAAAVLPAFGDSGSSVDLQIAGKCTISGTLRPAFERECYVCDLAKGTQLTAKMKGAGSKGAVFGVGLLEGGNDVPDLPLVTKGTTVSLTGYPVGASGVYRVAIGTDFENDGDYSLVLSWKPSTSFTGAGGPVAAGGTDAFTFSAPAGAVATIDVKPAKGSAFVTEILTVTGPGGFDTGAKPGPRVVLPALAATGDYAVSFRNAGAADGGWTAKAKLKLRKVKPTKVDIRDSALTGNFGADHTVYGRTLGTDGGTLDLPVGGGPLDGSSITVPAGTLGGPVVVTISSAPPVSTGSDHAAGPAVDFGPTGTVFDPTGTDVAKQATLTIPFDPNAFPNGTDTLVIYVRDAKGAVSQVPKPYTFGPTTVSFATSHLSTYQAANSEPRRLSGRFVALSFRGRTDDQFGGTFGFATDQLDAAGITAQLQADGAKLQWQTDGQGNATSGVSRDFDFNQLDVQIVDDSTVSVTNPSRPEDGATVLRRGESDDVLVGVDESIVLLRAAAALPTVSTIAGRWHVFHMGFQRSPEPQATPATLRLGIDGATGVVDLLPDGRAVFSGVRERKATTTYAAGTWGPKADDSPPQGLLWSLAEQFIRLQDEPESNGIRLDPVLGGDVLVGQNAFFDDGGGEGDEVELFVLVRASSGRKLSQIAGNYVDVGFEADTVDRTPTGQGLQIVNSSLTSVLGADGSATFQGKRIVQAHDAAGNATSNEEAVPQSPAARIVLKPDGSFTTADGDAGAVTPRGDLIVWALFDGSGFAFDFSTPASK